MMVESKNKIAVSVVVILAIIIFIALWQFFNRPDQRPPADLDNSNQGLTTGDIVLPDTGNLPPPPVSTAQQEEQYTLGLKQLAYSYSERFGSWSNHSDFKGLKDLKSLSTAKMQKTIDHIIANGSSDRSIYQGADARALSSQLKSATENNAQVLVKLQRTKYYGDSQPQVMYEDLLLKFVMIDGQWKVDSAQWQ